MASGQLSSLLSTVSLSLSVELEVDDEGFGEGEGLPLSSSSMHLPTLLQISLLQSLSLLHSFPSSHFFEQEEPQSTSVSSPFLSLSVQEDAVHSLFCEQNNDWQSTSSKQVFPLEHFSEQEPPQSTADSVPSLIPLAHDPEGAVGSTKIPSLTEIGELNPALFTAKTLN